MPLIKKKDVSIPPTPLLQLQGKPAQFLSLVTKDSVWGHQVLQEEDATTKTYT